MSSSTESDEVKEPEFDVDFDPTKVNDKNYIISFLKNHPLNNVELNRKFFHGETFKNFGIGKELLSDEEFVLEAVSVCGCLLKFASKELQKDRFIVLKAVKQFGHSLKFAEKFKKDREIVLIANSNSYNFESAFQFADESLRKDRKFVLVAVKNDGSSLRFADDSLKKDREFVLAVVKNNRWALKYADDSLKKDREIVLAAVKNFGLALQYADYSLKKDREIVLSAVKNVCDSLEYADDSLKKDREIVLAAVKNNGWALKYADDSLKKDREIVLAAVKNNGWALKYADDSLKKDREIVLAAVKNYGWALKYADDSLKKDRKIVVAAVKNYGGSLQYADDIFKKDREIVLAAVKNFGLALQYADYSLKKDRKIVLTAVKNDGSSLRFADDSLKKDREIVLAAVTRVKNYGGSLQYANDSFKKDREIVLAAVKNNGSSLEYADDSLKKDREIVLAAVKNIGNSLQYADDSLKKDREFVLAAVKNGRSLQYADDSLKKDREFVLAAVKNYGRSLEYADDSLKKDREIVLAAVKNYGRSLQFVDDSLKKDREIILAAVKKDGLMLKYSDECLKNNVEFFFESLSVMSRVSISWDVSFLKARLGYLNVVDSRILMNFICFHGLLKEFEKFSNSNIDFDNSFERNICFRVACYAGQRKMLSILLENEKVNPGDADNDAIKLASKNGKDEVVEFLIGLDDDRVDPSVNDNEPLKLSCQKKHFKVTALLLKDERVSKDGLGNMFESVFKYVEGDKDSIVGIVKYLFRNGEYDLEGGGNCGHLRFFGNFMKLRVKRSDLSDESREVVQKVLCLKEFLSPISRFKGLIEDHDCSFGKVFVDGRKECSYWGNLKSGKENGGGKVYENGKLVFYGNFVNGLREGIGITYNDKGEIEKRCVYKGGNFVKKIDPFTQLPCIEKNVLVKINSVLNSVLKVRKRFEIGNSLNCTVYEVGDGLAFKHYSRGINPKSIKEEVYLFADEEMRHENIMKICGVNLEQPQGILCELCDMSVSELIIKSKINDSFQLSLFVAYTTTTS